MHVFDGRPARAGRSLMVPTQGLHDHGFDVPVFVGPLLLETLLTLGFVTAGVAVALRPFLGGQDATLVAKAATLGAAAAGVSLLLTKGPAHGMPAGPLAALAIAAIAIPFAAARGRRDRLRVVVGRSSPLVVVVALVVAWSSTPAGAMFAGSVALAWAWSIDVAPALPAGWAGSGRPARPAPRSTVGREPRRRTPGRVPARRP